MDPKVTWMPSFQFLHLRLKSKRAKEMSLTNSLALKDDSESVEEEKSSRFFGKKVKWVLYALTCLFFFTFMKLPTSNLAEIVEGRLANELSRIGIQYSTQESDISIIGLSYKAKKVTIKIIREGKSVQIDHIKVSTSWIGLVGLLMGKFSGSLLLEHGSGELDADFSMKDDIVNLSFTTDNLDFAQLKLLDLLPGKSPLGISFIINGRGKFSGGMRNMKDFSGNCDLSLTQFTSPQQNSGLLPVPSIKVSTIKLKMQSPEPGTVNFEVNLDKVNLGEVSVLGLLDIPSIFVSKASADGSYKGKNLQIRNLILGSEGNKKDDLIGTLDGNIQIRPLAIQSILDIKFKAKLSRRMQKISGILDSFLENMGIRKVNGYYSAKLKGPLMSPRASPY